MRIPKLPHHHDVTVLKSMDDFEENVDWSSAVTKCSGLFDTSSIIA